MIPVLSRPSLTRAETAFLTRIFGVDYKRELDAWTAELQHIAQIRDHTLVGGVRYQTGTLDTTGSQTLHNGRTQFPGPSVFPFVRQSVSSDLQRFNVYLYDTWKIVQTLRLTAVVSYDRLDYPQNIDFRPLDRRETATIKFPPRWGSPGPRGPTPTCARRVPGLRVALPTMPVYASSPSRLRASIKPGGS